MRLLFLVSLILISACESPDDILSIQGQVLSQGLPIANQQVSLFRLTGAPPQNCINSKVLQETATDEEGRFSFEVFRAQTSNGEGPACFRVQTAFDARTQHSIELPYLERPQRFTINKWEPIPTVVTIDGGQRVTFSEVPSDGATVLHTFKLRSDAGLAWRGIVSDGGFTVEPWMLEDFGGRLELEALREETRSENPFGGSTEQPAMIATFRSAISFAAGPPAPSRGLACGVSPCPLTDGRLDEVAFDGGSFDFVLSPQQRATRVVLRGLTLSSATLLDTSDGGAARLESSSFWPYSPLTSQENFFLEYQLDAGVRSLRLMGASKSRVSELSVF
jgi:5-hydroxyisourate hydrolase-like protein (transthyretin family)